MLSYYTEPSLARGEWPRPWGGIYNRMIAESRHLPDFGWSETQDKSKADLVTGRLSAKVSCLDVFFLHGLYPTAAQDYPQKFWSDNACIIENLRRTRHVITVSDWVADTLRRDMHLSPWVLKGVGIELDKWDSIEPYDAGKPYVLWNKTRNYGVCDPTPVVELAKLLPDLLFITTFLPADCRDAPSNIKVTGALPYDQAWPYVKGAAVYLATTKETFGISTVEAMASEVPVVGYSWGATPDVLDGIGLLVRPGDIEALAEKVREALDQKAQLGQQGRAWVEAEYTWPRIMEHQAALFNLALEGLTPGSPRVSVVIPCYNYAQYLPGTIHSVFAQSFSDWELIVVDDGSTDQSADVALNVFQEHPAARTKLIRQENRGAAHARNHGIAKAQGEFIICLDADDEIAPEFIATLLPALEADPSLAIAYTGIELMNSEGQLKGSIHPWPKPYQKEHGLDHNQIPTCCMLRRSWLVRTGGYRQRFAPHGAGQEDADLWFRILALGGGAKMVTKEGLFRYRVWRGSTTKRFRKPEDRLSYHAWYPFTKDRAHPIASQLGIPPKGSWPVRDYDCPEVGIVIPVGPGHERIVCDALDSVEAQSFRNWEVMVVNDSGAEFDLTAWPFARLVHIEGRKGAGYARNVGTKALRAPLVVYLDADDVLQPQFLQRTLSAYRETSYWVYSDLSIIRSDGRLETFKLTKFHIDKLWHSGIAAVTALYPVAAWEQVGGFDEELGGIEDWDFHFRLASHGFCGYHIAEPLFIYRHATGKRRAFGVAQRESLNVRAKYSKEQLEMACSGCGGSKRRRREASSSPAGTSTRAQAERKQHNRPVIPPANWSTREEAGYVELHYTGLNKNNLTFRGPTGRKYRAGQNQFHKTITVHPKDAEHLLRLNCFEQGNANSADHTIIAVEVAPKPPQGPPIKPIEKTRPAEPTKPKLVESKEPTAPETKPKSKPEPKPEPEPKRKPESVLELKVPSLDPETTAEVEKILTRMDYPDTDIDITSMSVRQVRAYNWYAFSNSQIQELLRTERRRKGRTTIIIFLESFLAKRFEEESERQEPD